MTDRRSPLKEYRLINNSNGAFVVAYREDGSHVVCDGTRAAKPGNGVKEKTLQNLRKFGAKMAKRNGVPFHEG